MKLRLISENAETSKTVSDILSSIPSREWDFLTLTEPEWDADLTLWDYTPGMPVDPHIASKFCGHLFLVDRRDVDEFRRRLPNWEAYILLKPITPGILMAFLDQSGGGTAFDGTQNNRDEFLQYLGRASLKLQEYDLDRTNFLARSVHDLRVPLTAVVGYCELMLDESLGTLGAEQREIVERMQQSAKRLSRMVEGMFDLSIDRNLRQPEDFGRLDLDETVKQALYEAGPVTADKLIAVTADLKPVPGTLVGSNEQIQRLLMNLLHNSCKFTPRNGEIEIRGYSCFWERRQFASAWSASPERRHSHSPVHNGYRIDVRNSGEPILNQHLQTIFEEYTSYSRGQHRAGSGLGLAICRMIAARHCGRIWAQNTHRGPMFSLVLPLHSHDTRTVAETVDNTVSSYAELI